MLHDIVGVVPPRGVWGHMFFPLGNSCRCFNLRLLLRPQKAGNKLLI